MIALAIIVNAFGRRFAGGLLGQWFGDIGGTQVARLVQAIIAGATVAAVAPVWWWGPAIIPAIWIGATMGFPGCGMIPRKAVDVVAIAFRHGLAAVLPIIAGLAALDWLVGGAGLGLWWLVAAGLARGPFYWLATLWQPHIPALGLNPHGTADPPAWAEFWAGGALGAGLVLALGDW